MRNIGLGAGGFRSGGFLGLLALLLAGSVLPATAQEPVIPEGYSTGFHIVRPGENMRRITASYLGSQSLWRSNWELNPDVTNPDFLEPGQRLRVLLRPDRAVPSAQVVSVSGRVQERPAPIDWTEARRQDLIVESDGIQTFGGSSTALRFHDGTSLVLTEDSMVFLKVVGRTLEGIERRSVEIVDGQADLASASGGAGSPEIEILIGEAITKPKPGPDGASEARLRKSEDGSAQLMIYEGEGQVEAGGKTVAVARGMGTSVPEGAAPLPPEELLPMASMSSPASSATVEIGRLDFSWQGVEGAAGYTVEVCSDPSCELLVERVLGLPSMSWKPEQLPPGDFHWRVTAVSPSGLDGYPAATQPFSVMPERAEFEQPAAAFSIQGLSVDRLRAGGSATFYASTARVLVEVEDPSGVASWEPLIDGEPAEKEDLGGAWGHGVHRVSVLAEDRLGNSGPAGESDPFSVDTAGPELEWRIGGSALLAEAPGEERLNVPRSRWWLERARRRNADRVRSNKPPDWTLVTWGRESARGMKTFERKERIRGLNRRYSGLRVTGESPMVVILAPGIIDSTAGAARPGDFLVLEVSDQGAGVEDLVVMTAGSRSTGYQLRARCTDKLGNVSSASWDFASSSNRP